MSAIYKIRCEASRGPVVTPKKKKTQGGVRKNCRKMKYNDFIRSGIRRKVHGFFLENLPPTLASVLSAVNNDPDLPNLKRTTLYRLLNDIGFVYGKKEKKALLIERDDIISWRHRYLAEIRKMRNEGRNIVYSDESWINLGHTVGREWQDTTIRTAKDAFRSGLSCGLKAPTGRGPRFALVHAGGDNGFVPGAKLVFLCKKNTIDAHDEMDGECYEQYFQQQLIPNLPPRSVIVIDNAAYHGRHAHHGGKMTSKSGCANATLS